MLSHRSPLLYSRYMMRLKGPVGILLQGALVVLVGTLIAVFSLNNTVPIKKVTGAIQHDYVESRTNYASGSQIYDNTYLDIGGTDGVFIFGKNNFHPVWDDHVFVGQRVDIYYVDGTPRQVLALQLYDESSNPSTRFTTSAFDQDPHAYHMPGIGVEGGLAVMGVGLLFALVGAILIIRRRHRSAALAHEMTSHAVMQTSSPYASPPPKYEPPSRSSW